MESTWEKFQAVTKTSGEKFWRLPCTDDYREQIKSQIADIMNTGAHRWAGAITAAMFLKEFADGTPWLHLDIAGMAWIDDQRAWIAKGPLRHRRPLDRGMGPRLCALIQQSLSEQNILFALLTAHGTKVSRSLNSSGEGKPA